MEVSSSSVKVNARKRKKSPPSSTNSSPSIGVLTRSKSRAYFHHNRSGIARPDPVSRKLISCRPDMESVQAFLEVSCNNASRVSSIKDLRMRRVFTPDVSSVLEVEEREDVKDGNMLLKGSATDSALCRVLDSAVGDAPLDELKKSEIVTFGAEENGTNLKSQAISGNGSISLNKTALNKCVQRKIFGTPSSFSYRRLIPYLMDIVNDNSSVSKIELAGAGIPCKLQKLDDLNSEVQSIADNSYTAKVEGILPHFDDTQPSENDGANRVDASAGEESGQMTPPHPDIFNKTEVGHGAESMEANNVLSNNQNFDELSIVSRKGSNFVLGQNPDGKRGAHSSNRSVLNPCSQMRLFKNPRSFSYRRLLPFLMDMYKKNTCASRIIQHPMPRVDLKKDLHPLLAATAGKDCVNKIIARNSCEKHHSEDLMQNLLSSMVPPPPPGSSSPDANTNPSFSMLESSSTKYSSNVEPSSVTSETPPDPLLIDFHIEGMPQPQNNLRTIEPGFDWNENNSASPPSSAVDSDILTKQSTSEEPGPGKQNMCLDLGLELHDNNGISIEKVNLNQRLFEVEVSDSFVAPTNGPLKGILKRNRRGCRGLCNCLNCASFRLHADRAFEFSRDQMHDAEEVALHLMKELASLRILLEKSITNDSDPTAIQLSPVQLKQACNEALEVENLAKERLSQLKYDLNVHCRIPALVQSKVTFANYIQERVIPELDPSSMQKRKRKVM